MTDHLASAGSQLVLLKTASSFSRAWGLRRSRVESQGGYRLVLGATLLNVIGTVSSDSLHCGQGQACGNSKPSLRHALLAPTCRLTV